MWYCGKCGHLNEHSYPPYCEECIAFRGSPFTTERMGEPESGKPAQATDVVPPSDRKIASDS